MSIRQVVELLDENMVTVSCYQYTGNYEVTNCGERIYETNVNGTYKDEFKYDEKEDKYYWYPTAQEFFTDYLEYYQREIDQLEKLHNDAKDRFNIFTNLKNRKVNEVSFESEKFVDSWVVLQEYMRPYITYNFKADEVFWKDGINVRVGVS